MLVSEDNLRNGIVSYIGEDSLGASNRNPGRTNLRKKEECIDSHSFKNLYEVAELLLVPMCDSPGTWLLDYATYSGCEKEERGILFKSFCGYMFSFPLGKHLEIE